MFKHPWHSHPGCAGRTLFLFKALNHMKGMWKGEVYVDDCTVHDSTFCTCHMVQLFLIASNTLWVHASLEAEVVLFCSVYLWHYIHCGCIHMCTAWFRCCGVLYWSILVYDLECRNIFWLLINTSCRKNCCLEVVYSCTLMHIAYVLVSLCVYTVQIDTDYSVQIIYKYYFISSCPHSLGFIKSIGTQYI